MSERYDSMISWARDRMIPLLEDLDPPGDLSLFKTNGWDLLSKPYRDLVMKVFQQALNEEHYELSYNQTCNALNQAFQAKGWV